MIHFEIGTCDSSNLVALFQDVLAVRGPFQPHMDFRVSLQLAVLSTHYMSGISLSILHVASHSMA